MKKVLSLVLVIAMVLSSMSFAFAGTFTDVADSDYTKAIETLTALGVVTGYEDGTYRPEKTVTRAEMAKLMVEILGYGDLVAGSKSNFTDTQGHWADSWIALAAGKGLVLGTGDGKFTPDRTVSYDEAITMVVRGLGYTDACNELKNMTWPTNFKVKAAELGITKNVKLAATGADRGGVAQVLYNALSATLVTVDVDGNVKYIIDSSNNGKELLSRIATLDENFKVTTSVIDPKNKKFAGKLVDLEPYMFQELKVYLNDDDQVVYVKGTNSLVVEGTVDKVTDASGIVTVAIKDADGKIQKVTFTAADVDANVAASIFENGAIKVDPKTYDELGDTETIKIVADDVNGNGRIDGTATGNAAEVLGFVTTQVTKAARVEKAYVAGKDKVDVFALPVDSSKDVDLKAVRVTGAVDSLEDIKIDDVVVEYKADDDSVTKLVVSRDTVEGKITRTANDPYYIDGVAYYLNLAVSMALELGDEGIFYLDHNGDIVDFDGSGTGPTNYAVVIKSADGTTSSRFGTSIDKYPQLKLATQDNETVIFDVYVKINSSGAVTNSAKLDGNDLFTTDLDLVGEIADGALIKYSLNSDGRITKITLVEEYPASHYSPVDLDKASTKLSSNVIVFDATDGDYSVVNKSKLPTDFNAFVVRNSSSGEITVLVVKDGDIKSASDVSYAYISTVNKSLKGEDEVYTVVAYTAGGKQTLITTVDGDVDDLDTYGRRNVYAIKYDGSDIDDASRVVAVVPSATGTTTATAINSNAKLVQIGNQWYSLTENATIIKVATDWTVSVKDLNDITKAVTTFDYYTVDGEIDLIIIK